MDSEDSVWLVAEYKFCPNQLARTDSITFFKTGKSVGWSYSSSKAIHCDSLDANFNPVVVRIGPQMKRILTDSADLGLRQLINSVINIKFREQWTMHSSFRIEIRNRFSDFRINHETEFPASKDLYERFLGILISLPKATEIPNPSTR